MKTTREFVRGDQTVKVTAEALGGDRWRVRVGERIYELAAAAMADGGVWMQPLGEGQDRAVVAYGAPAGKAFMVRVAGATHTLAAPSGRRAGAGGADGTVRAPMTGTVLDVLCSAGDHVAGDQQLVVLSAMKMEHKLTAGIAGVVVAVHAAKGATVEQGSPLVVVEPDHHNPPRTP
jgi:biotin carboxyl carrier protein